MAERPRDAPWLCEQCNSSSSSSSSSVNGRNGDGLTPLLLASRDVDLFDRLIDQLNYVYSPTAVVRQLVAHHASVASTVTLYRPSAGPARVMVNPLMHKVAKVVTSVSYTHLTLPTNREV